MNRAVAGLALAFFVLALPGDLRNIVAGLRGGDPGADWHLALGLSLKTLMTVGTIVGLWLDKTFGYCFLLGASLQISLIRCGEFQAVDWREYPGQLLLPAVDLGFRLLSLAWLATRWRRMFGEGVRA